MKQKEIKKITKYIFIESDYKSAELAFVFGTRSWEFPLETVLNLYENNSVKKIIFSGGINRRIKINEAQTMAKEAEKRGVRKKDILIEDKSTNTSENVLFSKEILEKEIGLKNIRSISAVAKHYHVRRALMTLKKHLPKNIELKACPYNFFDFTSENWHLSEKGKEKVYDELDKIKKYLEKGDIEEL